MYETVKQDWESECKSLTEKIECQKAEFTHRIELLLDQVADRDRIIEHYKHKEEIYKAKMEVIEMIFRK